MINGIFTHSAQVAAKEEQGCDGSHHTKAILDFSASSGCTTPFASVLRARAAPAHHAQTQKLDCNGCVVVPLSKLPCANHCPATRAKERELNPSEGS